MNEVVTEAAPLSASDVDTLNAARTILARLGKLYYQPDSSYNEGLVSATADHAEHLVFQALNYADTYLKLHLTKAQLHPTRAKS